MLVCYFKKSLLRKGVSGALLETLSGSGLWKSSVLWESGPSERGARVTGAEKTFVRILIVSYW